MKNQSGLKAIYISTFGPSAEAFEFRDIGIPVPQENEVCIRVSASGLNFADIMMRKGLYGDSPDPPFIPGYDVEGTVHAVGAQVEEYRPGDHVFALTPFRGYAEYVKTDTRGVAKLPAGAKQGTGTALATQYATAYYAAEVAQTLSPGEVVLIHAAAGGVGTALVQLCKRRGCTIIGLASTREKIEYLKSMGVDYPIQHTQVDFAHEVEKSIGRRQVSAYFDNLGGKSIRKGKELLMPGGRIISFGAASLTGGSIIDKLRLLFGFGWFSPISYLQKSQALIGVNMLRLATYKPDLLGSILKEVSACYERGEIQPTIGRVFPASQVAEAHLFMESRQSIGKNVLVWEHA